MIDQRLVMHGKQHLIAVRHGRPDRGPRRPQRGQDHLGPLRHLGAGLADAEPDLAARLVPQARLAPHHRDVRAGRPLAASAGSALRHDRCMTRAADLGIRIGVLPSGPTGSVTDVPGAGVGHATVWRDEPEPPAGRGIARTGVTVLDPGGNLFRSPVPAGGAVLNGAGECTGFLSAGEWGLAETPVFLTSTMQVGRVYDAACELLMAEEPGIGAEDVIIPIVAECDDSFLCDPRRMQVSAADVRAALDAARGIGRRPGARRGRGRVRHRDELPRATRAASAPRPGWCRPGTRWACSCMSNFGGRERLTIDGVPVGRLLPAPPGRRAGPARRRRPGRASRSR